MKFIFYLIFFLSITNKYISFAILFGQQNEIRSLESLDGLWTFVREPINSEGIGLINNWSKIDLNEFENSTNLPVPAAFNDLSAETELRDHVGWVWYQKQYFIPFINNKQKFRSFIHFGSVQYFAIVFFNGQEIGRHIGGHLPFQFEIHPKHNIPNTITIAINNTLSENTIPPGDFNIIKLPSSNKQIIHQTPNFDFFNYAGNFSYQIEINSIEKLKKLPKIIVNIFWGKQLISSLEGAINSTKIEKPNLWWPKGMGKPNLYIAEAKLFSNNGILLDIYRETFGFRSVTINQGKILINKKSFYCHGFGMHEDFEVHGRGFDRSIMIKDFNMFEWLNGNCYRTTHYPYSEERAYEADRRGIAVITEVPAVGIRRYDSTMSKLHAKIITEMISRDKNHPSVIAWSLSNEPVLEEEEDSLDYFSELVSLTRYLDKTRPITAVFGFLNFRDILTIFDIVCLNRYYGWYHQLGIIESIKEELREELISFRKQFPEKPLYITEYGAEAIPGLHDQPSSPFTEQYQVELIIKTTQVFDELRHTGNLSGEMIWNFADFMTAPSLTRIMGNHKGVLTRDRKPKMAAHLIRKRYGNLLNEQQKQSQKNEL